MNMDTCKKLNFFKILFEFCEHSSQMENLINFQTELNSYMSRPRKEGIPSIFISQSSAGETRKYSFTYISKLFTSKPIISEAMIDYAKGRFQQKLGYSGDVLITVSVNGRHGARDTYKFKIETPEVLMKPVMKDPPPPYQPRTTVQEKGVEIA